MALVFERIVTEGLGDLSYLIGDDATNTAAVIDPRADVRIYVDLARRHKVTITHIFQTHIHEDFVSGALELSAALADSPIYSSVEAGASYGYRHVPLVDHDEFRFGNFILTARHTPGHTPEHISFLIAENQHSEAPFGIFSGGSLLINAAGRTDLLGKEKTDILTAAQYRTLYDFFLGLEDCVIVYPTHAHGSPCGASIGDRLSTSMGYERRFNPFLQCESEDDFHSFALAKLPPLPKYYPRLKEINTKGPLVIHGLPAVRGLAAPDFKKCVDSGEAVVVDTRHMLAFGGGHISNAINIAAAPQLPVWAAWVLDARVPILLVLESDTALETVLRYFIRTGFTNFQGYLVDGMTAWDDAGFEVSYIHQASVGHVNAHLDEYQIIDVRSPAEWELGHVPGATHIFLPDIPAKVGAMNRNAPTALYCDSGYRASLGASLLKRAGFDNISNIPGSWQAWNKAGLPTSMGDK